MVTKHARALVGILLATLLLPVWSEPAASENNQQNNKDIVTVIKSYEQALNSSDVDKVIRLYSKDGIFMPSNKPTSSGQNQVRKAYQHVFSDLDLEVTFHIDEIVRRDDIAFVRTVSDGEIKLLKENTSIKNNSRELFVMKRINEDWKIHRYMFNEAGTQKH